MYLGVDICLLLFDCIVNVYSDLVDVVLCYGELLDFDFVVLLLVL